MPWEVEHIGPHTLYRGDCREVLRLMMWVDVVVTDPPYGLGTSYASYDDSPALHAQLCQEWLRLMRETAESVFVFTSIRNLFLWERPDWILAWHKVFSVSHSPFGANNWEPVAVYGTMRRGERQSDFFAATFLHETSCDHPCPKPLLAMKQLLLCASRPGHIICDPFMGSGTTGVACVQLGRIFTGIEIERKYFDIACQRIEDAMRQPDLFVPTPQPVQQRLFAGGAP